MADLRSTPVIAVVDDDQSVLESLELLLESAGYRVRLFSSAVTLLEGDNLAEVDCLISDIDLPRIDGFQLLRLVHAQRPELAVILITGHHEVEDRVQSIDAGYLRLFKKPFDPDELLTAVCLAVLTP